MVPARKLCRGTLHNCVGIMQLRKTARYAHDPPPLNRYFNKNALTYGEGVALRLGSVPEEFKHLKKDLVIEMIKPPCERCSHIFENGLVKQRPLLKMCHEDREAVRAVFSNIVDVTGSYNGPAEVHQHYCRWRVPCQRRRRPLRAI